MAQELELQNDVWQIGINPSVGGAVTHGRVMSVAGPLDLLRPAGFMGRVTACFPLIPWSNRIGNGSLEWGGRHYQLRLDDEPGSSAIHGVVRDFPWSVTQADTLTVGLGFVSRDHVGINWPWAFAAQLTYHLDGPSWTVTTEMINLDSEPFPAGLGHHPYFSRKLGGLRDEVLLEVPCSQAFDLVDNLAIGPARPVEPRQNFQRARGFGPTVTLDDCLTGRDLNKPVRLIYPNSGVVIKLEADPLFECFVLYVPQGGKDFFALEPVTHANNGLSLFASGVNGTGAFVIEPGQTVKARWSLHASYPTAF